MDDEYIDLELKDDSGTTALAKAVDCGMTFEARHLLSAGANPMAFMPDGRPALYALWDHSGLVAKDRVFVERFVREYETPSFVRRCRVVCDAKQGAFVISCLAGRCYTLPRVEECAIVATDWHPRWRETELVAVGAVAQYVVRTDPSCRIIDEHFVVLMDMMLPVHSLERGE